jgi:nitrate reductase (cytochrome), electron transfer subunit
MSNDGHRLATPGRVGIILFAVVGMAAVILEGDRLMKSRTTAPAEVPVTNVIQAGEPIPAEAQVFRSSDALFAIPPGSERMRPAHPRRLATYRALRAYPGAPPRIPHGLTPEEFRTNGCRTCHERGGFSERFGAYVPITPHPEMGACLQCHVGDGTLMAIPLPDMQPNARCRQCHAPNATRWRDSSLGWKTEEWPRLADRTGSPPPIPHSLELRGNCHSCHSGPSSVEEIRTRHPERSNCRQCHVETSESGVFSGSASGPPASGGSWP